MAFDFFGRNSAKWVMTKVKGLLGDKVDKVSGKGLSTNDLTASLKTAYDGAVTDVGALKKVGAEKNTVVTVKVNGTALTPDSNRAVDVAVPTDAAITSKIEGYGYQTAENVESAITGKGYQTADQVNTAITGKGYQTASQVNSAITAKGYQTSAQVTSAINSALSGITGIDLKVVTALPTTGVKGTIYLIKHSHSDSGDIYDEYVWVEEDKKFEKIGNTDVDLSAYAKTADFTELSDTDLSTMWDSI